MEVGKTTGPVGVSRVAITADHRESASRVLEILGAHPEVNLQVVTLKCGDYEVAGRWLFERKTVADFARSIIDGRLFAQVHHLLQTGQACALIVEGRPADLAAVRLRRESIQGAMVTLAFVHNLPVLRSRDSDETARILIYAANQARRYGSPAFVGCKPRARSRRRAQLRVLQSLPGIGPIRAEALLDHFGSVRAVLNASEPELLELAGIGEQVIARIRWAIH